MLVGPIVGIKAGPNQVVKSKKEVRLATEHEFSRFTPDCTACHWRALLFVGFASPETLKGETRQPRRVAGECESFSDSCRAVFSNPAKHRSLTIPRMKFTE
jgi:hypothetical protein